MDDHEDEIVSGCHEQHDLQDHLIHYTKCLEFSQREAYHATVKPEIRKRIDTELRRIQFLRRKVETVEDDDDDKDLVVNVNRSHLEWKTSKIFTENIDKVRQWRHSKGRINGVHEPRFTGDRRDGATEYNPDVDFNAYAICYKDHKPVEDLNDPRVQGNFPNHKINMLELLKQDENNPLTVVGQRATNAAVRTAAQHEDILQRKHMQHIQSQAAGDQSKTEQQKTSESMDTTSAGETTRNQFEGDPVSYFHLPANNMRWVEKAMSRYYGEKDLDYERIHREPTAENRTRAYMLLRPQFWRGQEYGSRSAIVHARHMRPICEIVSTSLLILSLFYVCWELTIAVNSDTETIKLDPIPNNIVLFCPYLHWDTDRYRDRISQLIAKEEERERKKKESEKDDVLARRREDRKELPLPNGKRGLDLLDRWPSSQPKLDDEVQRASRSFSGLLQPMLAPYPKLKRHFQSKLFDRDPRTGRIRTPNKLGQLLIDAARLYEAMSCFRDKALIRKYLHSDPPELHPRRTLDQAYYCTLKSTKWRDRDQVVYRGTRANPQHLHSIDPETGKWNCPGRMELAEAAAKAAADDRKKAGKKKKKKREEDNDIMTAEELAELAYQCPECQDHIRKVARLIMVDQLWMWILDERTIITCFPRRYGVNRKDPSGVHHLVRRHIKNIRQEHIRTVFDLALIVLMEVTNIFFDRAKTTDHQPQVIDIFADAIGEITNKQAVAFDHLWVWTSKIANLTYPSPFSDVTAFVFPLLNINPEGKLQREIKDIVDELDIMLMINRQQLEVIRKFVKHAEDILDPAGVWRGLKGLDSSCDDETDDLKKKRQDYLWFKTQADELLDDIGSHISELEGLRSSAESTSSSLDNLLGLMQQQASALQAWQSARQAEETVKQGRAIMMFTTVTIIFLPLSFMAGIFGMNNYDFATLEAGNTMSFHTQLVYMFGISVGIIVLAVLLAYSARSQPIVAVFWRFGILWLVFKSGLFNIWLTLTWKRDKSVRWTDKHLNEMRSDVLKDRQRRMENDLAKVKEKLENQNERRRNSRAARGSRSETGSLFTTLSRGASRVAPELQLNGRAHRTGTGGGENHELEQMRGANLNRTTSRPPELETRESTMSGLTTLAPATTAAEPDPSRSSGTTMRGGWGRGGERFRFNLGRSSEEIV
ncbi:hypothetical protein B0H66DRAFT_101740 [Apodospora peruviana]|uniref:Uncharacterized protein n=1 Tax=Apodospora peruviana TaxID=516989 RepID=A0AAE0LY88_9PEZI|nr:hypothetical protein B0H66DRAFT_101740 [Apodospora peruviana]